MQLGIVFLEKPQGHDGFRTFLNLVQKQQGLARLDGDINVSGKFIGNQFHINVAHEEGFCFLMTLKVDFRKILESFSQMTCCR